jgi:hypothetical protein
MKILVAFFYGNGIPCPLACQVCHACNGRTDGNVTEYFYTVYDTWQKSLNKFHLPEYYNVQIKGYVYINAYRMDQHELVTPQVRSAQLGIENTQFPELIKSELERVRAEVTYY